MGGLGYGPGNAAMDRRWGARIVSVLPLDGISLLFCSGAGTGPGTEGACQHDIILPDLDDGMRDNIIQV